MACGGKRAEEKVVMVTIEPQRFFAEQIAGDRFVVRTVVPSGQSPETYDPTPRQMVEIGQSIAYLRIGAIGFEQAWMQKIAENNPQLKLYDLSDNMPLLQETEHEHSTHAHQHGGGDPHIWSSIEGARVIAWNTLQAFMELDKEHTDYYWANYNRLATRIVWQPNLVCISFASKWTGRNLRPPSWSNWWRRRRRIGHKSYSSSRNSIKRTPGSSPKKQVAGWSPSTR